jgi:hypothetical protein
LNARNVKPADIHHQICEVYGENAMSYGMVRKWVRKFNEGRDNMHDEPLSYFPNMPCIKQHEVYQTTSPKKKKLRTKTSAHKTM